MTMDVALIRIAVLARPHGLRGEIVALPVIQSEVLESLVPGDRLTLRAPHNRVEREVMLRALRADRDRWLVTLEGIADRTGAERCRGCDLLLPQHRLPALENGRYYAHEILGLSVECKDGEHLGRVEEILDNGAHEIYAVVDDQGRETLIPAVAAFILEVNLEQGRMVVQLLDGMRYAH